MNNKSNEERIESSLTYEKMKSLYLHKAVLDELRKDWDKCSTIAYENIERWKELYRPDGMSVKYLDEWSKVLDNGFTAVSRVLLGVDEYSCDLRQNSPFAGVLSDERRLAVLEEFREIFGESESSFHNASLNNIVEKVEINEVIKEIQEKLKGKIRELKKNNWSLLGTLIGFFAAAPLVILLSSVIDSPAMLGFSMLLFSGLLVFYRIFQLGRKEKTLIQEIDNLVRKMLEEELDGKLIGDPILSVKWNLVKVQQNNKIVEYVVRIIVDENDNESFEIRELK